MAAKTKKQRAKGDDRYRDVAQNRRALHEYAITDRYEAGIVLQGSEVKGIREGGATISDAYVQIRDGEAWLVGAHFSDYANAGYAGHDPRRTRKLLLHRREIERIAQALSEKGLSVVPLRLYFKAGRAKLELGLGRGKTLYDKRRSIAERDARRDAERAIRAARR
ncbi:SsrA-binding protein SmpB [Miltoncostaea marina]|uniref:SsrA-binding protein SmpB n=1 Tax=Miltoncostaea marina TaxID=2843215 RepID=UPI001C3E7B9E|nr:SsrA-binding protein SmpB [Miltoncostaea marina]